MATCPQCHIDANLPNVSIVAASVNVQIEIFVPVGSASVAVENVRREIHSDAFLDEFLRTGQSFQLLFQLFAFGALIEFRELEASKENPLDFAAKIENICQDSTWEIKHESRRNERTSEALRLRKRDICSETHLDISRDLSSD